MTAVIVRRLLRSTPFPPTVTWLAALILFTLGCILPFIAAYAFFPEQRRYAAYQNEMIALYLPNPFIMIDP